jgi:hypothetical protein
MAIASLASKDGICLLDLNLAEVLKNIGLVGHLRPGPAAVAVAVANANRALKLTPSITVVPNLSHECLG